MAHRYVRVLRRDKFCISLRDRIVKEIPFGADGVISAVKGAITSSEKKSRVIVLKPRTANPVGRIVSNIRRFWNRRRSDRRCASDARRPHARPRRRWHSRRHHRGWTNHIVQLRSGRGRCSAGAATCKSLLTRTAGLHRSLRSLIWAHNSLLLALVGSNNPLLRHHRRTCDRRNPPLRSWLVGSFLQLGVSRCLRRIQSKSINTPGS